MRDGTRDAMEATIDQLRADLAAAVARAEAWKQDAKRLAADLKYAEMLLGYAGINPHIRAHDALTASEDQPFTDDYKQARGAVSGTEPAEKIIRRLRGDS